MNFGNPHSEEFFRFSRFITVFSESKAFIIVATSQKSMYSKKTIVF